MNPDDIEVEEFDVEEIDYDDECRMQDRRAYLAREAELLADLLWERRA